MEYPRFLVLEASSYEEDAYPIAASWSIADGQLKAILIRPEDEWQTWDASNEDSHGITRNQIEMVGESVLDIIRELSDDVDKQPVYVSEPFLYEKWLTTLFAAYGADVPFDIYPLSDLFNMDKESLEEELEILSHNLLLDLKVSEERVRTLLELYARLNAAGLIPEH